MKRGLWLIPLCFGLWTCNALADTGNSIAPAPEPFFGTPNAAAVLQNPGGLVSSATTAVNTLQPSVEEFRDFIHGDYFPGSTFALWQFSSKQIPIASLRAGWGNVGKVLGEVKLDVAGVTKRYVVPVIPDPIKSALTYGVLDDGWKLMSRYGLVAGFVGYDLEHHDTHDKMGGLIAGFSLGGSF